MKALVAGNTLAGSCFASRYLMEVNESLYLQQKERG